ncbi:hypothetical protein BDD12DRAFT_763114, partial [Trichophaea hybrida]
ATKASQKLSHDWEDQCEITFFQLVYTNATSDIHPSLILNTDQMMIHFMPSGNEHIYDEKESKQVSLYGLDEKREFTLLMGITVEATEFGKQSIWCRKTATSIPKLNAHVNAD